MEKILKTIARGGMIILTDDEARENEGDLMIAAQYADADAINFMARFGRGLICLALDDKRVRTLELPLMSPVNRSRHGTAFTISIEAKTGITTGISASDRAHTIRLAIDEAQDKNALVSPGHVFPLVAARGGVLVRAGHTEAAVDLARLAKLNPSGVICEIMNDDGSMAKQNDLKKFAKKHKLPLAQIKDLIAWRLAKENHLRLMRSEDIMIADKNFILKEFKDDIGGGHHIAIIKGDVATSPRVCVRVHALDGMKDVIALLTGKADDSSIHLLRRALHIIGEKECGVALLMDNAPPAQKMDEGLRHYGIGAQILRFLGVRDMLLLTNHATHIHALDGFGLRVLERLPLEELP